MTSSPGVNGLALWSIAIADFVTALAVAGTATTTRETRRQHLSRLAKRVAVSDPWLVTGADLLAYMGAAEWASETRRSHRASLRTFYAWGVETGRIVASPALALPKVAPAPPRPKPTPDHAYTTALAAASRRERLMVRLGAEVGLRRAEVAQVHSRDLHEDLTGWSLVVHGKGGKDRLMPLPDGVAAELRALPSGFAFPGRDRGHLSPRWVGTVVGRLLPEGHTMHGLRHRFATRSYEVDRDLAVVQELLGHASPATTRRYVAVGRDRLRATVNAAA